MTMFCFDTTRKDLQPTILQYLLNRAKQRTNPAARCASLCILIDLFKADILEESRKYCLKNGILETVQEIMFMASQTDDKDAITILQFTCAVKIVWQISQLKYLLLKDLISAVLLEQLLDMLHPDGQFYYYSSAFSDKLKHVSKNKYLVGQCVPMKLSVGYSNLLKKHHFYEEYYEIPKRLYECQLFDTSGENDVNISKYLIGLNLAWTGDSDKTSHSDSKFETWDDILVTETFVGNVFWAQVGESAIKRSKNIHTILKSNKSTLFKHNCKRGDLVAVVTNQSDDICYRARVISCDLGRVKVFAIDFGFTELVDEKIVFSLPVIVGILEFPMQASLCFLSGVRPPPVDVCLIQTAAAALCNLIRFNIRAGKTLNRLGAPDNLLPLLNRPEATIVLQVMRMISNLSHNPAMQKPSLFSSTLLTVLHLCRKLLEEDEMEKKVKCWLIEACLACVTNLMRISYEYRNEFQQNQGLDIVLKLAAQTFRFSRIYKLCLQLLRNFIYSAGEQLMSTQMTCTINPESVKKETLVCTAESKQRSSSELSPEKMNLHTSLSDEEEDDCIKKHLIAEETTVAGCGVTITADLISNSTSIVALNSAAAHSEPDNYYEYGSEVEFSDDATHELRPNHNFYEVSSSVVIEIVCSMLNSGRNCTIYFGIRKDRIVWGMNLLRNDKDEFRLGVDRMMQLLSPQVLYFQYELVCVPVVKSSDEQDTQKLVPVDNLYVAEIRLNSNRSTMYTVTGVCFYRFGHNTSQLSSQEVRQLAVLAEEEIYKEEIMRLRDELSSF